MQCGQVFFPRLAQRKEDVTDPIVELSTLVEILRWRALQQPEQRTYTYLVDGEAEGDHLTYAALDNQARSIGALLQSYQAIGERALLLYPAGLEFIAAFFGCLYAGVIAVPLPPLNLAQPQRTLPRLRAIIRRCTAFSGAHHVSDSLRHSGSVHASSRAAEDALVGHRQGYQPPSDGMARPSRDQQHRGVAPVHLRLHRGTEGRRDQSRESPSQFSLYQPRLRAHPEQCHRHLATGLPRHGAYQWDYPTDATRDVRVT